MKKLKWCIGTLIILLLGCTPITLQYTKKVGDQWFYKYNHESIAKTIMVDTETTFQNITSTQFWQTVLGFVGSAARLQLWFGDTKHIARVNGKEADTNFADMIKGKKLRLTLMDTKLSKQFSDSIDGRGIDDLSIKDSIEVDIKHTLLFLYPIFPKGEIRAGHKWTTTEKMGETDVTFKYVFNNKTEKLSGYNCVVIDYDISTEDGIGKGKTWFAAIEGRLIKSMINITYKGDATASDGTKTTVSVEETAILQLTDFKEDKKETPPESSLINKIMDLEVE